MSAPARYEVRELHGWRITEAAARGQAEPEYTYNVWDTWYAPWQLVAAYSSSDRYRLDRRCLTGNSRARRRALAHARLLNYLDRTGALCAI